MTFVDTNVFMYAVGKEHPRREEARTFFVREGKVGRRLVTSSDVLQELLHAYIRPRRFVVLDAALRLVT